MNEKSKGADVHEKTSPRFVTTHPRKGRARFGNANPRRAAQILLLYAMQVDVLLCVKRRGKGKSVHAQGRRSASRLHLHGDVSRQHFHRRPAQYLKATNLPSGSGAGGSSFAAFLDFFFDAEGGAFY
jgi:hypothetical protein